MIEIFGKVLPFLLFCLVGIVARRLNIFTGNSLAQLKKLLTTIIFPCLVVDLLLFIELDFKHISLVIFMFTSLFLNYLVGLLVNRLPFLRMKELPLVCTTYCYGFLAAPLFLTMRGKGDLTELAIMGASNDLFIWIFFMAIVSFTYTSEKLSVKTVGKNFTSPAAIAMFLSLFLNLIGVDELIQTNRGLAIISNGIAEVGRLATPIILICIGYGFTCTLSELSRASKLIIARLVVTLSVAYALKPILNYFVPATPIFDFAFFTLAIMPPAYVMPVMIGVNDPDAERTLNAVIVISTVISVVAFAVFSMLNPA